jgi:DNA invertase Pin-like site-specific DNA recombinase
LWERPEGKRLLADAKAGKFNVIIVYKFNRQRRRKPIGVYTNGAIQT